MSTICGIIRTGSAPVPAGEIDAMLDALAHWQPDGRGTWTAPGIGLGHLLLMTSAPSRAGTQPLVDGETSITGDVRLDNRETLGARFGITGADLESWTDARLVVRAYREWGDACAAHLLGDFAFAIWDGARSRLYCARDHFGVKPFYYAHAGPQLAFASEIKGLLALPWVDRSPDEAWIGDCLHRIALDNISTLYGGIRRLPPAHALTMDAGGVRISQYWTLESQPDAGYASDADYVEAFRDALVRAVRRRAGTPFEAGGELSGGLDSSGVCAIAHDIRRDASRGFLTFSQVRPADAGGERLPNDEAEAIALLCGHAGMANELLAGGGGILDALAWAEAHCDEPPRSIVSLYNDRLYEAAAARGVRVLLSGFAGNQGVSSPTPYDGMRAGAILRSAWSEGPGQAARVATGLLRHQVTRPSVDRLLRRRALWQKHAHRPTRDDFARRVGMGARAYRYSQIYSGYPPRDEARRHRLHRPDVAIRLESANLSATHRRIEYRYPLLDVDLVKQYAATPARLKHRGGVGRYLFREAIGPWVPDEIRFAAGPRASANPGVALRKRRDRDELEARILALEPQSPVLAYVDPRKLAAAVRISRGDEGRRWRRITEMLTVLILERKLRDAAREHAG